MEEKLNDSLSELKTNVTKLRHISTDIARSCSNLLDDITIVENAIVNYPVKIYDEPMTELVDYVDHYNTEISVANLNLGKVSSLMERGGTILISASAVMSNAHPESASYFVKEISAIQSHQDKRNKVYSMLYEKNQPMADMFISSWESLETPSTDETRGPAFLMRETITKFLHYFSPDDLVCKKPWYERPDERTKITRAQRMKYILEECTISDDRKYYVEKHLKDLINSYNKLNKAHDGKSLDTENIKLLLYQTEESLYGLLALI